MFKHQTGQRFLAAALVVGLSLTVLNIKQVAASPKTSEAIVHRVTAGENLWVLANYYGVSIQQLVNWNGLSNPDKLRAGQTLVVHKTESRNGETSVKDVELLAKIIYAEARGEDFEGQVAVGAVILNRLKDPQFPKTIQGVVYQPGAFTAIYDRQIRLEPDYKARSAAIAALTGMDPTGGALFYYNPVIATDKWIKTRPVLKVIGNHTFSS